MSVIAIYKLGLKAGLSEAEATAAAEAVIGTEDLKYLATKADLAELKADLTWRITLTIGIAMGAQTAILGVLLQVMP